MLPSHWTHQFSCLNRSEAHSVARSWLILGDGEVAFQEEPRMSSVWHCASLVCLCCHVMETGSLRFPLSLSKMCCNKQRCLYGPRMSLRHPDPQRARVRGRRGETLWNFWRVSKTYRTEVWETSVTLCYRKEGRSVSSIFSPW